MVSSVPIGRYSINVDGSTTGFFLKATNSIVVLTVTGALGSAEGAAAALDWAVEPLAYLTYQAAT